MMKKTFLLTKLNEAVHIAIKKLSQIYFKVNKISAITID